MPILNIFFASHPSLLVAAIWLSGWFYFFLLLALYVAGFIISTIKKQQSRKEEEAVLLELGEKSELLKYAEVNKQKALDEAAMVNRSKRELLSKISHELRTPMNAMWGMASLLNETNLSMEQQQYTSTILKSGEGLLNVINDILLNDILQYSKLESGKELEARHFSLRTTIEEVLETFGNKTFHNNVDLLYCIDDNVPSQIIGDPVRIRQILMNMVENASRFTRQGEIYIGVRVAEQNVNGLKLAFEIRDTGLGMTTEKLTRLAADLAQTDDADTEPAQLGLALTICKKLVNLMGGAITVDSTEKLGTTFRFTIATDKSQANAHNQKQIESKALKGKKVLVADDNIASLELLKQQLAKWEMNVLVAQNGKEALTILEQQSDIELALIDQGMPEMNGIQLAVEIKKRNLSCPLILLHKNSEESYQEHNNLFKSFINKPVKQHLLFKEINDALTTAKKSMKATDSAFAADFAERHPLEILIAEDDAMNQQMIKMVLKKLGYESQIATNGKEVLEMVSHRYYDIILMDVQMPEMDGLEATRMIRLCLDDQPVIVAMTANTMQGDREECLESGMNDYISKPVNLSTLISVLEKWSLQEKQLKNIA